MIQLPMTTPTGLTLTSEITVEEIQQCGSDDIIAHAAWVSRLEEVFELINEKRRDGVLRTMVEKRHGTPFEKGYLLFRVHAPIKVWREWHRHRIGFSYSEESARYKELAPVFYVPPRHRPMIRPPGFRPMSPDFALATEAEHEITVASLAVGYEAAWKQYRQLLDLGVDRGLARDVLGVGIYSACWVTANPRSIMAFLELRTREDTALRPSRPLFEIDVAARKLEAIFARHWPITHRLWCEHGRMAP